MVLFDYFYWLFLVILVTFVFNTAEMAMKLQLIMFGCIICLSWLKCWMKQPFRTGNCTGPEHGLIIWFL